ncbi:hypothetical protein DA798_05195 [Lactobacillus sp. PFC-70]|nr:hypothetical protein DA798_05195 [Lactobacillus sp. PFC-70]
MFYLFPHQEPIIFTIGGKFSSSTQWQHEKKQFTDYELIIGLQGQVYLQIDHHEYIVQPQEVLLVPYPSQIQGYRKTSNVVFFWLHFAVSHPQSVQIRNYTATELGTLARKQLKHHFILPNQFKLIDAQEISVLVYQLLDSHPHDPFFFEESNAFMTYLLLKLSSQFLQTIMTQNTTDIYFTRMMHIKNWVRANMSVHLKVEQIANAFGLTPQYLSRFFKRNEGQTLIEYINNQKIKVACELLLRTTLSVKQISNYAYFKNEKQFFLQFRKCTGTTPLHYRQIHGPIHTNNPDVDPELPIPKKALLQIQKEARAHSRE